MEFCNTECPLIEYTFSVDFVSVISNIRKNQKRPLVEYSSVRTMSLLRETPCEKGVQSQSFIRIQQSTIVWVHLKRSENNLLIMSRHETKYR